jgi:ABC-type transport system involved in multi-copper enzyme maturation permease subunit
VLALLNVLANERLKLRRNKLLPVCTLIAILVPAFMVAIDLVEKDSIVSIMTGIDWLYRLVIPIQVIVYPVLSGFVITFLIQKEYVERTMINTLTAPTSRSKFLLGKYIIWTLWAVIITVIFLIITCVGYYYLFGFNELKASIAEIAEVCLKAGILNLLSMSPLLIVCILQRNIFYPSLLCSCIVSGIGFTGLYWRESIRNIIPWSAVTSICILNSKEIVPYVSIFICYIMGVGIGIYCFKHQNQ